MANLSNSSDMIALEGLPEDLRKSIDINLHSHYYQVIEQGVIMIKISVINELRMYNLPNHSKSTASFISGLLNFVDDLIDRKHSVDSILIIQKSIIKKPANNPPKSLPDVASQDAIRTSQAEFFDPKSPRKSTETISSTSMLRSNKAKIKKPVVTKPVWLIASPV